jgi:site-specific DNA-methyltransferase (adenine-specific)
VSALAENAVYCMDALELLRQLPDGSVDAVITDLPYGTTDCAWDEVIPFAPMWEVVNRALKPNGVFVTTSAQPFTSALVMSNPRGFRHCWVWIKRNSTGFLNAKRQPMRQHEDVLVFAKQAPIYTPQMTRGEPYKANRTGKPDVYRQNRTSGVYAAERYPTTVIDRFHFNRLDGVHPTQKPVALFEYLVSTYTKIGDLVVDPTCGSGTTLVAARNLQRRFIGSDTSPEFVAISQRRLDAPYTLPMLGLFAEEGAS